MYIADRHNHRIRKVTVSTGIITTVAGTGSATYGGDGGPATSAGLYLPIVVALDSSGLQLISTIAITNNLLYLFPIDNMYVADWYNNRIRKVTVSTGIITTIAGTGASSYSGDGGPATSAELYKPIGVALDSTGIQLKLSTLIDTSYLIILCR